MNTPRTDAAKSAFYQTDSLSDLWAAFSDVEIERNKAIELYEACGASLIAAKRELSAKSAECQRLRALVQDAYDDPDSEILGEEWNDAARVALQEVMP